VVSFVAGPTTGADVGVSWLVTLLHGVIVSGVPVIREMWIERGRRGFHCWWRYYTILYPQWRRVGVLDFTFYFIVLY
jgi:hypothetical protein